MLISIKDIFTGTNISDSWCDSKVARINDILANFAIETYELYPQKVVERFQPADCKWQLQTKYPIAKVRGFWWKGCNIPCSEAPEDCCAGYRKLLLEEMYWDNLDKNAYSFEYPNTIKVFLPNWLSDAFVVYSKGFPIIHSTSDKIDIDPYMLSLLRLYMKAEYSLESDNDVNMSANYRSLFTTKLKKLQDMYMNNVKYIFPWALSYASR